MARLRASPQLDEFTSIIIAHYNLQANCVLSEGAGAIPFQPRCALHQYHSPLLFEKFGMTSKADKADSHIPNFRFL